MEPFPKRFRSEFDGPRSRELLQGEAAVEHQRRLVQEWGAPHLASGRGGDQECRRFNTPEGCPYGSFYRFRHVPSGSFPLLQAAAAERRLQELGALKVAGWRGGDHECRHFNTAEGCPYGLACHFWHVPKGSFPPSLCARGECARARMRACMPCALITCCQGLRGFGSVVPFRCCRNLERVVWPAC